MVSLKLKSLRFVHFGVLAVLAIVLILGGLFVIFRSHASSLPGDANGDGTVNILDLSILASNWGKTNATLSMGDFNGDTVVNILDLSILASNWGRTLSSGPTVPTGLSATAASSTQVNLNWIASTDTGTTPTYIVYRNSAQIATSASTTYQDPTVAASTTYTYTVAATDANGTSAQSTAAQVMTPTNGAMSIAVSGNHLVDGNGNTVQLHGVNRSGPEYMCTSSGSNLVFDGPSDSTSLDAIASWHANAVRIPVNEDCWLGINGLPNAGYSAASYQQAIVSYVNLLHTKHLYAILDLQWAAPGSTPSNQSYANAGLEPMPDADHAPDFWTSAATAFKNDRATLFDVFNEPYPDNNNSNSTAAWTCWKNGGTSTSSCPGSGLSYTVAGMQQLVTTIRNTGAANVIMLGGINYSNGLLQWSTYVPSDPLGQLAASFHNYLGNSCNTTTCYNSVLTALGNTPLVTGEFGEFDSSASFMNSYMSWADSKGVSYLAWTWDTWGCGSGGVLITNYNGTPCSPDGTAYQSHLQATFPAP